jgi:hypothetical protein
MGIDAAAQAKVKQLETLFSDALGADAVLPSKESGRAYLKVAEIANKDGSKVVLYANATYEPVFHKTTFQGKETIVRAAAVAVRFMQRGGLPDTFNPPLQPRKALTDGFRLSKHTFPICALVGVDVLAAYEAQNVTDQLVKWIVGVAEMAGAKPVATGLIGMVVDQAKESITIPPEFKALFTMELPKPIGAFDPDVAKGVIDDDEVMN